MSPGLAAAPSILDVTATPTGGRLRLRGRRARHRRPVGRDPGGLDHVHRQRRELAVHRPGPGRAATRPTGAPPSSAPSGRTLSDVRFMVQAVNGVGLVSVADNYGSYYSPLPPTAANANKTTVTLDAAPAHLAYGKTATFSATLSGAVEQRQPADHVHGRRAGEDVTDRRERHGQGELPADRPARNLSAVRHVPGRRPGPGRPRHRASSPWTRSSTTITLTGSRGGTRC